MNMKYWYIGFYWPEDNLKDFGIRDKDELVVIRNFNVLKMELNNGLPDGVICSTGILSYSKTCYDAVERIVLHCLLHNLDIPHFQYVRQERNGKVVNKPQIKKMRDLVEAYQVMYDDAHEEECL